MNDFTKNVAQALFNQDEINDLLRKELQQTVNDLLEAELTAFLGYDPYARAGWNTGNSRNGAYFRNSIPPSFPVGSSSAPRWHAFWWASPAS